MTPTHISTIEGEPTPVTAWQFSHGNGIPVWVARHFHNIDSPTEWLGFGTDGHLIEAHETDWAICIENEVIIVLTDAEFQKCFKPIPGVQAPAPALVP